MTGFALKTTAGLLLGSGLLILLFPAELARTVGMSELASQLNRAAVLLTGAHVRFGVRYGCGNQVYFGYMTPFDIEVPGIAGSALKAQLGSGAELVYVFVSDFDFDQSIARQNGEIEAYNAMVFARCGNSPEAA